MVSRDVEPSLLPFVKRRVSAVSKVLLMVSVVQMIGVQTISFIAVLGAAGLSFGSALSGTLQNFAVGLMMLNLNPFKIGTSMRHKAIVVRCARAGSSIL